MTQQIRTIQLDMTPVTVEIPRYLREDLKALAAYYTKPGHRPKMKAYLVDLIDREKKQAGL